MSDEKVFYDINKFVREMKRQGITRLAFAEVNERRADQVEEDKLEVVPVIRLELLAYKEAVLYKCIKKDIDLDTVHAMLREQGFELKRSSRNIT